MRCRDVPIQVRPTFIKCTGFSNTHRSLLNDGYFDTSVLCGHIRRWVDTSDAPAGTSLHPASRKSSRIAENAHIADMGTIVISIHPFFVDISAGGLKQRTHLPVRPYIPHRGKPPRREKHPASRKTSCHTSRKSDRDYPKIPHSCIESYTLPPKGTYFFKNYRKKGNQFI